MTSDGVGVSFGRFWENASILASGFAKETS